MVVNLFYVLLVSLVFGCLLISTKLDRNINSCILLFVNLVFKNFILIFRCATSKYLTIKKLSIESIEIIV